MSKRTTEFLPPVTYQGGKGRLAAQIVEIIGLPIAGRFYDLCCGSGAISVAAVEAGQAPERITMIDLSPWGLFWKAVGDGTFDVGRFEKLCARVPANSRAIKPFVEMIFNEPVNRETYLFDFLLLQASTVGGRAITIERDRWAQESRRFPFRDYWEPTAASSRRSPVNPMMPMPATIAARVRDIAKQMRGVTGICGDLDTLTLPCRKGDAAYIDPPYEGTSGYGTILDVTRLAGSLSIPCWVSEGRSLSEGAILLSSGRLKGGMTGNRKRAPNEEWLSPFGQEFAV